MESKSVTAISRRIMPRTGPREELFSFLKEFHYDSLVAIENSARSMVNISQHLLVRCGKRRKNRSDGHGISKRVLKESTPAKGISRQRMISGTAEELLQCSRDQAILFLLSVRYLRDRSPLPSCSNWLLNVLPNYSDDRFRRFVRMTRRQFRYVVQLLEGKASQFFHTHGKQAQLPIHTQLHLALYFLGHYGNGAGYQEVGALHGYSEGVLCKSRRRVCNAICSLGSEYIQWPQHEERKQLCVRAFQKFGFKWAFFVVDGTTHPFSSVPSYQTNNWFDRKSRYSMQSLVSCDLDLKVRHLVVGWPGSSHDARVLRSADYMRPGNEAKYFSGNEHGLGDAAFGMHRRVIPNYKEPLASFPENREYNEKHSSFRVLSEHCIGHVKNRFQGLREIRIRLRKRKDLDEIVRFIMSGFILHNILLDFEGEVDWNHSVDHPGGDGVNVSTVGVAGHFGEGGTTGGNGVEGNMEAGEEEAELLDLETDDDEGGASFRETVKHQVLRFHGFE